MVILILLIVDLFLWFLSLMPVPGVSQWGWATSWLAWIAAVLLTVYLFVPGLRWERVGSPYTRGSCFQPHP